MTISITESRLERLFEAAAILDRIAEEEVGTARFKALLEIAREWKDSKQLCGTGDE